jgi:hypothetical protein
VGDVTLFYMRIACIVLWVLSAIALLPSVWRFLRYKPTVAGEWKAACFFAALLGIGNSWRWFVSPDDQSTLLALTCMTGALATYVLILSVQGVRDGGH